MRPLDRWSARRWLVALLVVLAQAGAAAAEEPAAARGELLYRVHCRSCHGDAGRGDGPMASQLAAPPSDLTRLSGEDGAFDAAAVRRAIDGRLEVPGHASREMPVWGLTFQERGTVASRPDEVEGRLDDLIAYLRSIQAQQPGERRSR